MSREINLVPDIKGEMIKALKLRNLIFFICIVVASASVVVTAVFGTIAGGQQAAVDSKETTLKTLSTKLNSYGDLSEILTIKNQLGGLSAISNNKKVLSRTFNILSTLLPTGADKITVSELSVNLAGENPTFSFDAQANAFKEPFIDYNVLDAFKKSMEFMRYDYGNYVDKNGNAIPAYCIIESDQSIGGIFNDASRGLYGLWTINEEGCNPSSDTLKSDDYVTEYYNDKIVVKIWRTPQYNDWYKETEIAGEPYMSLDGQISGVEHFESACITYTGSITANNKEPKWTDTNDYCRLVPEASDNGGIRISDSSNGRASSGDLVLRFSATISLAPEVYSFKNSHVITIAPTGRRNVTDSYVQIQTMFSERAKDCEDDDTDCSANTNNLNGGNS